MTLPHHPERLRVTKASDSISKSCVATCDWLDADSLVVEIDDGEYYPALCRSCLEWALSEMDRLAAEVRG